MVKNPPPIGEIIALGDGTFKVYTPDGWQTVEVRENATSALWDARRKARAIRAAYPDHEHPKPTVDSWETF